MEEIERIKPLDCYKHLNAMIAEDSPADGLTPRILDYMIKYPDEIFYGIIMSNGYKGIWNSMKVIDVWKEAIEKIKKMKADNRCAMLYVHDDHIDVSSVAKRIIKKGRNDKS